MTKFTIHFTLCLIFIGFYDLVFEIRQIIYIYVFIYVCVFLAATFFFHINAFRGDVNFKFFKMLHRRKKNNAV